MTDYVCFTILGQPDETESAFKSRLYVLWTDMLRNYPDDYEKVYAEATKFEPKGNRLARQYMLEPECVAVLVAALARHALDSEPVDLDDCYSQYEATSPDWYQLDH